MSYSFRERLYIALKDKLREQLKLSQADVQFLKDNIMSICPISDELLKIMKEKYPEYKDMDIDEIVEKLSDQDFIELCDEVIKRGFKKLNYNKKKDKKKVAEEPEQDSDSDADSDSDSDSVTEEEPEQEVECET